MSTWRSEQALTASLYEFSTTTYPETLVQSYYQRIQFEAIMAICFQTPNLLNLQPWNPNSLKPQYQRNRFKYVNYADLISQQPLSSRLQKPLCYENVLREASTNQASYNPYLGSF